MSLNIRQIRPDDNPKMAKIIRSILEELDYAIDGTVYTDPITDNLYEYYQQSNRVYYVVEEDGKLLGGSGIAPIENQSKNYCELQKMYLTSESRGKGIGSKLMELCLDFAKEAGYELVYLETFDGMNDAQKLYKKYGFDYIDHSLGDTGHFSCNVKMTKVL